MSISLDVKFPDRFLESSMFYHHFRELALGPGLVALEPLSSGISDLPQLRLEHLHKKYPKLRNESKRAKRGTPLQLREHSVDLEKRNSGVLKGGDELENLLGFYGAGNIPHDWDASLILLNIENKPPLFSLSLKVASPPDWNCKGLLTFSPSHTPFF